MPYSITLVQLNASTSGFAYGGTAAPMGFPSGNFSNLVYSQWMCGGHDGTGQTGLGPAFSSGHTFLDLRPALGSITLGNSSANFFTGSFAPTTIGLLSHALLSVSVQTQTVQLYINDIAVPVTGTWTGAIGSNWFNLAPGSAIFEWDIESGLTSRPRPAIADIWCASPASFLDLSIIGNRRRFIAADLTPVYLGSNGSEPLGVQPQIYLTVQSGGVPNDLLTNRGTGVSFGLQSSNTLAFQAPGICVPPTPPPALLALDNVVAIAAVDVPTSQLVFLSWSDDRGHSWSNPVGQPIGARGDYLASIQWQRLGLARDRVFRLEWSVPVATALQGAYVELDASAKS